MEPKPSAWCKAALSIRREWAMSSADVALARGETLHVEEVKIERRDQWRDVGLHTSHSTWTFRPSGRPARAPKTNRTSPLMLRPILTSTSLWRPATAVYARSRPACESGTESVKHFFQISYIFFRGGGAAALERDLSPTARASDERGVKPSGCVRLRLLSLSAGTSLVVIDGIRIDAEDVVDGGEVRVVEKFVAPRRIRPHAAVTAMKERLFTRTSRSRNAVRCGVAAM